MGKLTINGTYVVSFILSSIFGVWYFYEKHWVANNVLGIAFAMSGIELISLGGFGTACVLLCGLFFYDIFWVFATDVMVTVAKSFEAPIKLLFPQDILVAGWYSSKFSMLGLGDIVIPGIVIALLLRFDRSRGKANDFSKPYFWGGIMAYIFGLITTIAVMHVFRAAQPALLYLVPTCLGVPIMMSISRKEFSDLFAYKDYSDAVGEVQETKLE